MRKREEDANLRFASSFCYTSGLSLMSFGLRGYCFGVLPVFLMYRIARLSSKVGRVTVRTS